MTDMERDLRQMMTRQVDELVRPPVNTRNLVHRARRRRAAGVALAGALAVAIVVGGAAMGRSLMVERTIQPIEPDPNPVVLHTNGDVAFVRDEAGKSQLYVVDATGGEPRKLDACPGACNEVWIMSADWSPDGTRIAYAVAGGGLEDIGDLAGIYVLDVRTGESQQLTQCTSPCTRQGGLDGGLDWSPDGNRIAYEEAVGELCNRFSDFAGSCSIYTMAPDGSDRKQLPMGSLEDAVGPSWSPDGAHIAFSGRVGTEWNVYTMALDGSGLEGLSADRPSDQSNQVAWSPTGSEIAFEVVNWPEYPEQPTCELWTVGTDGSDPNLISEWCEIGGSKIAFSGSGPEWSPDGTRIAYYDGNGIRVIKPDGSDSTKLAPNGGRATGVVAWQPLPKQPHVEDK